MNLPKTTEQVPQHQVAVIKPLLPSYSFPQRRGSICSILTPSPDPAPQTKATPTQMHVCVCLCVCMCLCIYGADRLHDPLMTLSPTSATPGSPEIAEKTREFTHMFSSGESLAHLLSPPSLWRSLNLARRAGHR